MKNIYLATLAFCLPSLAWTQEEITIDLDLDDSMPEFCVATMRAIPNDEEMRDEEEIWLVTYELKDEVIAFHHELILHFLASGQLRGSDILEAAKGCKKAREEAWINEHAADDNSGVTE